MRIKQHMQGASCPTAWEMLLDSPLPPSPKRQMPSPFQPRQADLIRARTACLLPGSRMERLQQAAEPNELVIIHHDVEEDAMGAEIRNIHQENEAMRGILEELKVQQRLATEYQELNKPWHKQGWVGELRQLDADLHLEARALAKQLTDAVRQQKFKPTRVIDTSAVKDQLRHVKALQRESPFKFSSAHWWRGEVPGKWLVVECATWRNASLSSLVDLLQASAVLSCQLETLQVAGLALDMFDMRLSEEQLGALVSLPYRNLAHLNLADNELTEKSGQQLALILQRCHSLDLSLNPLGCVGVAQMLQSVPITPASVQFLDLSDTELGAEGAAALATGCSDGVLSGMCELRVASNAIGDKAAARLVHALRNCKQLHVVDLRETGCCDRAVTAVTELVAHSSRLSCVRMCKNTIFSEGASVIAEQLLQLSRPFLMTLNMAMIDEVGGQTLLRLVRKNKNIAVSVMENNMGHTKLSLIQELSVINQQHHVPTTHWATTIATMPSNTELEAVDHQAHALCTPTRSNRLPNRSFRTISNSGLKEQADAMFNVIKRCQKEHDDIVPTGRPSFATAFQLSKFSNR